MKISTGGILQTRAQIHFLAWAVLLLSFGSNLHAINGLEGTFEFSCDAPWRIEPHKQADGSIEYGSIPIQISIHDAMYCAQDDVVFSLSELGRLRVHTNLTSLGKFRTVYISELGDGAPRTRIYYLESLYEDETTRGDWNWPSDLDTPQHGLCRVWAGENPEPFRDVSSSSEWHASLWYEPRNKILAQLSCSRSR
jgi:hypothetical protein